MVRGSGKQETRGPQSRGQAKITGLALELADNSDSVRSRVEQTHIVLYCASEGPYEATVERPIDH